MLYILDSKQINFYIIFRVAVNIEQLFVHGLVQDEDIPCIVSSERGDSSALLDVLFETNPIDKKCGQRLSVKSQPLKVIYDAMTINKAVEVFKVPKSSALGQLVF